MILATDGRLDFVDEGAGYAAIDKISYRKGLDEPSHGEAIVRSRLNPIFKQAITIAKTLPPPDYVLGIGDGTPEDDRLHIRGGHRNLGDELPRRFLTALGGEKQGEPATAGISTINSRRGTRKTVLPMSTATSSTISSRQNDKSES